MIWEGDVEVLGGPQRVEMMDKRGVDDVGELGAGNRERNAKVGYVVTSKVWDTIT